MGDRGSTVVKVLCYKSEGRWTVCGKQWSGADVFSEVIVKGVLSEL